jgi:hypothetical protein
LGAWLLVFVLYTHLTVTSLLLLLNLRRNITFTNSYFLFVRSLTKDAKEVRWIGALTNSLVTNFAICYRWKKQFKQLLEDTGYVTPGKHLSEVRVLFMGRECFEALSEHDCQQIYDAHQRELIENAKHNFQELLLEHADLFYHFKSIAPTGTITQDDIKEITDVLQDDFRYKMLDRLDQDRKVMLFQHLGFIHCPIREHCPAFPNCMDALIERILATKVHRPSSWNHSNQWLISSDNNQLHLLILGADNLAENLAAKIRVGV